MKTYKITYTHIHTCKKGYDYIKAKSKDEALAKLFQYNTMEGFTDFKAE